MDAKDLMIGNYHVWDGVECKMTIGHSAGLTHKKEDLEPIPLTEEWMYRLEGSENSTIYLYKGGDKWFVTIQNPGTDSDFYNPTKEIKYVHEWQNAYKFWEGEDLKIK